MEKILNEALLIAAETYNRTRIDVPQTPLPNSHDAGRVNHFSVTMSTETKQREHVMKSALECRTELLAYARSLLGNYSLAEDVLQDAMIVVFNKYDQFQEGTSILAWCRSIVRIEVLRVRQKQQREQSLAQRLLDDAVDSAYTRFQKARKKGDADLWRETLKKCLDGLPAKGQRVLIARFDQQLSYEQIGKRLGMSTEAVRKALFRLRRRVRSCVELRIRNTP